MSRAITVRTLSVASTLLVSSFIIFAAMHYSPGSSLAFILGGGENTATPEQVALVEAQYGLKDPLFLRYWHWISGVFTGDWGRSYAMKEDVWRLLGARLPTTLGLIALACTMSIFFGVAVGALASIAGRTAGIAITAVTTVGFATPGFVAAIILVSIFAVKLGWFPALGSGEGFIDGLWHLILPSVALGLTTSCVIARITRVAMTAELGREHVQTAIIRGVPKHLILWRHVLRNALIPIVTVSRIAAATMVAGTVVIEFAFGLHGLGTLLIQAVQQKDVPVVQAISVVLVGAYVLVNFVVDLLYLLIDPRVRLANR
ncbi:ABC transporter permease [Bosea sp. (in: a-proteobacteria)]|jgi:peptide/nickel transport system permease protein|uniref:ABC transporter permease n=1 Tax=Bosea sp. (in: a-proteobacteria) TaxID=1871050 RepID=UPI002DDD5E68|nr:ABC transporter permease [Bosea sp. (in: a-proteobacteria)]HEV2510770.1 ABC transporter permease [Bosea sp. (in: a-proteobacteria)]